MIHMIIPQLKTAPVEGNYKISESEFSQASENKSFEALLTAHLLLKKSEDESKLEVSSDFGTLEEVEEEETDELLIPTFLSVPISHRVLPWEKEGEISKEVGIIPRKIATDEQGGTLALESGVQEVSLALPNTETEVSNNILLTEIELPLENSPLESGVEGSEHLEQLRHMVFHRELSPEIKSHEVDSQVVQGGKSSIPLVVQSYNNKPKFSQLVEKVEIEKRSYDDVQSLVLSPIVDEEGGATGEGESLNFSTESLNDKLEWDVSSKQKNGAVNQGVSDGKVEINQYVAETKKMPNKPNLPPLKIRLSSLERGTEVKGEKSSKLTGESLRDKENSLQQVAKLGQSVGDNTFSQTLYEPVENLENSTPIERTLHLQADEPLVPKLANQMEAIVREERTEVRIQLKPEHLGELRIKLSLERGIMMAEFVVENESVREVLANQLPQLQTALQEQGAQIGEMMVNIGFNQGNSQEEPARETDGTLQQRRRPGNARSPIQVTEGRITKDSNPWNQVDLKA